MQPLQGLGVLLTRPAQQADGLAQRIEAAGGKAIRFPALEIFDIEQTAALDEIIDRLDRFDLAIFISPTAAEKGMAHIRARRALPPRLRIAAVGAGSARALSRLGVENCWAPTERQDSEGLLALPQLQELAGQRVVIFRGVGGRETLAEGLAARGAQVEYAECYRRGKPQQIDPAPLLARWTHGEVSAVSATSAETVRNLAALLGAEGQALLRQTPLFVPHERIAAVARGLGVAQVFVTAPGEAGLTDGLIEWWQQEKRK